MKPSPPGPGPFPTSTVSLYHIAASAGCCLMNIATGEMAQWGNGPVTVKKPGSELSELSRVLESYLLGSTILLQVYIYQPLRDTYVYPKGNGVGSDSAMIAGYE